MRLHFTVLLSLLLFTAACSSNDGDEVVLPVTSGLAVGQSTAGVETSFGRLTAALQSAGPVGIVAEVDHQRNASGAGLSLRPTRVVLFGNPALGTPLMQANPQAGLDLPQNMLVYEDADGNTLVAYNTTDYLAQRHGVGSVSTLPDIAGALAMFAETAAGTGASIEMGSAADIDQGAGIVAVASPDDVATTYARLRSAIAGNDALTLVAELDHQANARSVGLDLPPTRLIVFGNPNLGTPLMQNAQTVAIDLPQKMLVYQGADGQTMIVYNDPAFLASRHGLDDVAQIATIGTALAGLAAAAAGSN